MKVALDYQNLDGVVCYDEMTRTIRVELADEERCRAVRDYLAKPVTLNLPGPTCADPYVETSVNAADSVDDFTLALTRLWEKTGVLVQWSRIA